MADRVSSAAAEGVRILYGGSVKAGNAEALFSQTDIDGGLVGGASLDAAAADALSPFDRGSAGEGPYAVQRDLQDRSSFDERTTGGRLRTNFEVQPEDLLGPRALEAFARRILNVHPSLLPAFPGLAAQRQALEHGVKVSGCTVHFVDEGLDSGPIVVQKAVPVADGDTAETLAARILEREHEAYPLALQRLLTESWHLEGRRLVFGAKKIGERG